MHEGHGLPAHADDQTVAEYGHLGIPPDPTTGTYEIDFRPERLQRFFDLWMQSQFDRTIAKSKLDVPPPSLT
jgi:hypothetical protein